VYVVNTHKTATYLFVRLSDLLCRYTVYKLIRWEK